MADYKVTDTELISIANAIRTKGGTQAQLEFPTGFVSAVNAIPTGGGGSANILYGPNDPESSSGNNGDIYLRHIQELPVGYTLLDYIQGNGAQYATLDYLPTIRTKAEIAINTYNYNEGGILGSFWGLNGFFLMMYQSKFRWHTASAIDSNTFTADTDYIISVDNNSMSVNGDIYQASPSSSVNQNKLTVFYTTSRAAGAAVGRFRMYYLKLFESNSLTAFYVPVKRDSDDVVGLYDLVSNDFNYGTGGFAGGNESEIEQIITNTYCKVNGVWQSLVGTNINDVNLGGN